MTCICPHFCVWNQFSVDFYNFCKLIWSLSLNIFLDNDKGEFLLLGGQLFAHFPMAWRVTLYCLGQLGRRSNGMMLFITQLDQFTLSQIPRKCRHGICAATLSFTQFVLVDMSTWTFAYQGAGVCCRALNVLHKSPLQPGKSNTGGLLVTCIFLCFRCGLRCCWLLISTTL